MKKELSKDEAKKLRTDLKRLEGLAFGRPAHCGPLLRRFFALKAQIDSNRHGELLWRVYEWLLVPLSLWPVDFEGLAAFLLEKVDKAEMLERRLVALLRLIDDTPSAAAQEVVGRFEHDVESGRYDKMLKQAAKFKEKEEALLRNDELASAWRTIKELFPIKHYQSSRGVIRRRVSGERNFREGWHFGWDDARKQFGMLFDALCYRWNLYGMQKDRPLLMKVTVNPTPYGTLIMIPAHQSLDPRRDLDWALINRLHRARGATRQGPEWSSGRVQKLGEAQEVVRLIKQGRTKGLKGRALHEFICRKMNRDLRSDPSWWKRLAR